MGAILWRFKSSLAHQNNIATFGSFCCFVAEGLEPIGENCRWQFARKSSLENLFSKTNVSGSPEVTKSSLAHHEKGVL